MRNILRPTLTRRIVLVLLLGYPLAWGALMCVAYMQFRAQQQALDRGRFAVTSVGLEIRDALTNVDDPTTARAIAAAFNRMNEGAEHRHNRLAAVFLQVRDRRDQNPVFSSPQVADVVMRGDPHGRVDQLIHGQLLRVFELDTPRWSVLWGRTSIDMPWMLEGWGSDLLYNVTIAFPFVLLPAWLAVAHGLRPLRRLSQAIAGRSSGDLSPVDIDARHAELKPLVTALNDLLQRLRVKVESEQTFVASAAHELRTPLAVITAQAHTLIKADTTLARAESESRLNSAVERASHLIHQLLAVARMQMQPSMEPSAVDVGRLAEREVANFVTAALERRMELSLQAPDSLVMLTEAHTFRSILQNLIDNAIRYGREDGTVVVDLSARDGTLTLSVTDDGPGIPEPERALIFERFYRGTTRNDVRGSGLGLTIVRQAATRLGGKVEVSSGPGERGCRLVVEIPSRLHTLASVG